MAPPSAGQSSQAAASNAKDSEKPVLNLDLKPITNAYCAFKDLVSRRENELIAIADNGGMKLRVATICSGTEAPIFALKLIKEMFQKLHSGKVLLEFEHVFSVENEPFKQAYIARNTTGGTIFRDVVDFSDPTATKAPTTMGDHVTIPSNIDLLIAGTSCVDFSTLNSNRKKGFAGKGSSLSEEWKTHKEKPTGGKPLRKDFFNDVHEFLGNINITDLKATEKDSGQSSLTFFATMSYIIRHRPKIVILENVNGAPWSIICDVYFHAIGYEAAHASVDTKDYYIPQTRLRGYAVAVDREVFRNSAKAVVNEWNNQMGKLKRGASSPVQDWLLPANDPLTMKARQDESERAIANGLKSGRDTQWERSKLRHSRVRRQYQLGDSRPLTAWGLGTTAKPYDRLDHLMLRNQNDRALDCIDIYFLRSLGRDGFDIRFKSLIFDLTQNIDRGTAAPTFGVTGCLTPRGQNLISDQGRLVSGFEALNLQGLPLRDLDLTRESQDELRDLAGNAMTTTVMGAALISLHLAVHIHSNVETKRPFDKVSLMGNTSDAREPLYLGPCVEEQLAERPFNDMFALLQIYRRCRRYCYCGGGAKYSTNKLLICSICGTTRCESCAGNPSHTFDTLPTIVDPIMDDTIAQEIMTYFPTAISDVISLSSKHIPFNSKLRSVSWDAVLKSLLVAKFYYVRVLVTEHVTVCYKASDSNCSFNLQAVVSSGQVTWYLALDPWTHQGQKLCESWQMPARDISRPFGRMIMDGNTGPYIPRRASWEFWTFTQTSFQINILKPQPGLIHITAISGSDLNKLAPEARESIRSAMGHYCHYPNCDAAESSLHSSSDCTKKYLFKDPSTIGSASEDCYVVSTDCRFLARHEFREVILSFTKAWTPAEPEGWVKASIKGFWSRPGEPTDHELCHAVRQAGSISIPQEKARKLDQRGHMVQTVAVVSLPSNINGDAHMVMSKYGLASAGQWALVSRSDYSALFDLLAPINIKLHELSKIEMTITTKVTRACEICCPVLPQIYWLEKGKGREPYRLSYEMGEYEEKRGLLEEPFRVVVHVEDTEIVPDWKILTAHYEVNVDMLAHRAISYLPEPRGSSVASHSVAAQVDVSMGSLNISNLRFNSFRTSLRPLHEGGLQESVRSPVAFLPEYALTRQQQISFIWMLGKEREPGAFTEREIEEHTVSFLNLRLLGVAQRDVKRAGGILADEVGYGKTVISLALMGEQQNFDQGESKSKRDDDKLNTRALSASLVIAPRHLVDQWASEAKKFLGWKYPDVIIIKSSKGLRRKLPSQGESNSTSSQSRAGKQRAVQDPETLVEELQAAKLVIVSTAVFDETYYAGLGELAGSLAPPNVIPKNNSSKDTSNLNLSGAFQDWYEDALTHARKHVSGFDPNIFNLSQLQLITNRLQSLQLSHSRAVEDYYDKHTRLGSLTIQPTERIGKSEANTLSEADFEKGVFIHVLEAFSFARVFYDEFSYESFNVALFVKNAHAHSKWVLSATAPTSNLKAICSIADLLGIHVARPTKLRPGLPRITEGPELLHQDSAETQLSYGKLYSDKGVDERMEQGHAFLRCFASANPFDEVGLGKIEVTERVYCSRMRIRELARYLEFQRNLQSCDLDASKLPKGQSLDSDTMAQFSTDGKLRAGQALAFVASTDCGDDYADVADLLQSRKSHLVDAQHKLKTVTDVAVWLVNRKYTEATDPNYKEHELKPNMSATSITEDLACFYRSIRDRSLEFFGGADALEAITIAIFGDNYVPQKFLNMDLAPLDEAAPDEAPSAEAAKVKAARDKAEQVLFKWLNEERTPDAWATYFLLKPGHLAHLKHSELVNLLKDLRLGQQRDNPTLGSLDEQAMYAACSHLNEETLRQRIQVLAEPKQPQPEAIGKAYPTYFAKVKIRGGVYTETESALIDAVMAVNEAKDQVVNLAKQVKATENIYRKNSERKCDVCGIIRHDLYFVPECGHFLCESHLQENITLCGQVKSRHYPQGSGCPARLQDRTVPVAQIDCCWKAKPNCDETLHISSKSWDVARHVTKIVRECNEDVLVFYQFDKQRTEICDALAYYSIEFHDVLRPSKKATPHHLSNEKTTNVRVINITSEQAAGKNYQNANHVIFVSTPVLAKQEDYDTFVKQAKGRAVRHGQDKKVFVHYYVSANTFEVDLLQLRTRSTIRLFRPFDHSEGSPLEYEADLEPMDGSGDTAMTDASEAGS
ncbi:hypothetical protein F5Y19DRAFT_253658 [Xylariaceae sp. FL1651]|nr:hypothetical protein F5Y19DRAFT_253658 [Xylariaceae sp. FL1651]